MVSPVTHNLKKSALIGLLLAALALSACRQAGATPTAESLAATNTTAPQSASEAPPPSETPPPTEDNSILFQDDFSELDSGWPTVQADHALASYQDPNIYQLLVNAGGNILLANRPGAFSDFSLETLVTGSSGEPGQFRYGLSFRQITPDNYYAAFINPVTQSYVVAKRLLGAWTTLAEGVNAAIPAGGEPVTLRLDAQGPNLTFSINGTGLVTVADTSFAAGDVGFIAETLDAPAMKLEADSIVIRRFNADTVPSAPTAAPVIATETSTPSESETPTEPPPTVRPVGGRTPLPPTPNLQTALPSGATAIAATAAAAATQASLTLTQACSTLPCP
ncbi:MAG: hypothetical protein IT317_10105 [Anaerolineales bacterium]|nr:hypothetical protein [Anaerolineales bacterium]